MDMQRFARFKDTPPTDAKLRRHCEAIRRNKDVLAAVFQFLNEDPPNASAALECFEEMTQEDQIAIWSVSTTAGGIWERWEREALKTGRLEDAYAVWAARNNRKTA